MSEFTVQDGDFIVGVLGRRLGTAECLIKLLADEESRDLILDDQALFDALLEHRGCLRVSSRQYFYVLVRHVFRRSDLRRPGGRADYVGGGAGGVLRIGRNARRMHYSRSQANPLDYFFELVTALQNADEAHRVSIAGAHRQPLAFSGRSFSRTHPFSGGGAGSART